MKPSQKNVTVNAEPSQESEEKKIPVYVESSQEYEEKEITVNVDVTEDWKIEAYKLEIKLYFLEVEILAMKENQKEEAEKLEAQLKLS